MTVLAQSSTRQDLSPQSDFFSSPSSSSFLDIDLYEDTQSIPAAVAALQSSTFPPAFDLSYGGAESDSYILDSRQSTPYDQTFGVAEEPQYMHNAFSPNPRFRVQQSTLNQELPDAVTPPPMSEGSNWVQSTWDNFADQTYLSPQASQAQHHSQQGFRAHKRLSSDSSIGSTGPDSPYNQSSVYHPHIVDPDTASNSSPQLEPYDITYQEAQQGAKALFYPSSTTAGNTAFVNQPFRNLSLSNNNSNSNNDALQIMARQNAMKMAQQCGSNMDRGSRNTGGSFGGTMGGSMGGSMGLASDVPTLDRTVSAIYQDELYDPKVETSAPAPPSQPQRGQNSGQYLSPHRSVFNERLHEANNARSISPSTDMSRDRSPFRYNSECAAEAAQTLSQPPSTSVPSRINSAAQIREQQKMQDDARAYAQHHPQVLRPDLAIAPSNTISPKEARLEFDDAGEESNVAASNAQTQIKREADFSSGHAARNQFVTANNTSSSNAIENLNGNTHNTSYQNYSATPSSRQHRPVATPSSQQIAQSNNNFPLMAPSVSPAGGPQQYPFMQMRRQNSSMQSTQSDSTPVFPASFTSMESTRSEVPENPTRPPPFGSQETSSSQRSDAASPVPRPADTSANAGTYICVSHGCTARFDTSAKLQKHRKDNHRGAVNAQRASSSSPNAPTSATSQSAINPQAAANNLSRNNAPGPHKCERINPSTGKPCNTVFSRSYDLTRHEDTIHNNRKHKVRCHLCTEEKTFSRNDALTRHMRVVHPDVDFPGRNRNRR
ncbi:MAG: hypothetical protein OHK93_006724 [Ramalina farinacea]|uniref:C2H2-type domain-containing protein n=1 Tax=Ramalina farinacea TaxID=258253 RepID=A0AA43TTS8_9LECA|nr:hypothetical protein [Ramalina farinacea]